jgi:hypothetical protein
MFIYITTCILIIVLFLKQDLNTKDLETNIISLVHGGGFGAWCWYKTISLLEDSGFEVNAIDLTGSGIHSYDQKCPGYMWSNPADVKP